MAIPETWNAFLRRIHEIRQHHADGTVNIYDSVEKYLNREEEFKQLSNWEQINLPFAEE